MSLRTSALRAATLIGVLSSMLLCMSCEEERTVSTFRNHGPWKVQPTTQINVEQATMIVGNKPVPLNVTKDVFGPGLGGQHIYGRDGFSNELRFACRDLPEGDYYPGLSVVVPWQSYFGIAEQGRWQLVIYHNDTRLTWSSYTEPLKPENSSDKNNYQCEVRIDSPVHIKPGDIVRIAIECNGGPYVVGPLKLYGQKQPGPVSEMGSKWETPRSKWLFVEWGETKKADIATGMYANQPILSARTSTQVTQACTFTNPGVLARTFTLKVQARDFLMSPLMPDVEETVTIPPGQTVTRVFAFTPSKTGRDRLTILAEAEGVWPAVRKAKYFIGDRDNGRTSTYLDGKGWEFCYAPGVDPGNAPPADAQWKKVEVPSIEPIREMKKENGKDVPTGPERHLGWYRKTFKAPPVVKGERYVLQFGQVLTEAWVYVNGKLCGHEIHGTQPFEVDITDGYKPGRENKLEIAVRDWIAYSPKNQERARKGEPLSVRQDMIDVADYECAESIGINSYVQLEGRAAVAVEDVDVITSVREKKLKLNYRLVNKGTAQTVTVTPQVLDEGKLVKLDLEPKQVTVPADGNATVSFETSWRNPQYWWPENPHLYGLVTRVHSTRMDTLMPYPQPDRHSLRFGFREIWIDGHLFVLNGVKVKFRGNYGANCLGAWLKSSDPAVRLEHWYDRAVDQCINNGNELNRTHLVAVKQEPATVCDELGAMVKMEGEVHQVPFTWDNVFWQACLDRNVALMHKYKNHASVVHWGAGNENMWGLIYLGSKPANFVSDWQYKIAKAMQDNDPMRRPVDWEADGDLFGKWNQNSLHYSRDIAVYPDVPGSGYIGPWDGKTVAQDYQFGPIILGKKPVCIGESFWINPTNPYPQTAVLGDVAYTGYNYLWKGWFDTSIYFINGFRDAEFAYIDTLVLSPKTIPHQVVILKDETAAFFGGRTIQRAVNVHNDVHTPQTLVLRWSLTVPSGKPLVSDFRTLNMQPAELKRLTLDVPLPRVPAATNATWRVQLFAKESTGLLNSTEKLLWTEERAWRIFPAQEIFTPAGLELSMYDPVGATADALLRLGVDFIRVTDLSKAAGTSLIIGEGALDKGAPASAAEALAKFVKDGGKVLVLAQAKSPDFLPVTLQLAQGKRQTTIAFVRAGDHPIVRGLTDGDMRWWAGVGKDEHSRIGEHYVSDGTYMKPAKGNVLPLVDIGGGDGLTQAPLLEIYDGKGSFIVCQMPIVTKATLAPQAAIMLQNTLGYLAKGECFRTGGRTALLAAPASPLRAALTEVRLQFKDLGEELDELVVENFDVAIVDVATGLKEENVAALQSFAHRGGRVLLHRATPAQQALLENLLGVHLRMMPVEKEPRDIQNHVMRTSDSGLLAGVSNQELWWMGPKYLAILHQEGNWSSIYYGGCPAEERVADYFCWPTDADASKVVRLTRPDAILQVPKGKGYFVLNQLKLDQQIPEITPLVQRLRSLLLTNLGCTLKGDADIAQSRAKRLEQYRFTTIDLSAHTNRGLKDDKASGLVGFANQGENDIRDFPTGKQTFAGIPFQIASPKSVVALYSTNANNMSLPKEVKGIKIGQKADGLFFLHTCPYSSKGIAFKYVVRYEDGSSLEVPIEVNRDIFDWWTEPITVLDKMAQNNAFVAWQGTNPMVKKLNRWGIMIPGWEWVNPSPEKAIREIDFVTAPKENDYAPVPCLLGITAATIQGNEGVVTDVIGTGGLKVKIGDQVKDVYYIGVGGIEESHPFHAKAVDIHKTMVVGKKVNIVYDAVRQDNLGRTIAYVYLGGGTASGDLLNGRVLTEGLSRLGDFAGNDRLRTLLMNTGEPAKWRKVGMWSEQK